MAHRGVAFWLDSASKVLRCFLLAADLAGLDMLAVQRWVTTPVERGPEAVEVLEDPRHRGVVPHGWAGELAQVLRTDAKRTRESIFLTLSQTVAFMADPVVAAAVCPGADEPVFDVARFLADRSTLYVIMSERPHASVAPLAAAFTTYVFEAAKRIAATMPKGRLDPPLGMILDEIALTTPVPLDRWCADAGGRGIHIVWSCQSPSQLAQRWGRQGADTIWNCANAKVLSVGLTLDHDLEAISRLCGERREEITERVRVLPVNDLRELPQIRRRDGRLVIFALLIHRATPATIVRVTPVWERRDVKAAGAPRLVDPDRRRAARRPGRAHRGARRAVTGDDGQGGRSSGRGAVGDVAGELRALRRDLRELDDIIRESAGLLAETAPRVSTLEEQVATLRGQVAALVDDTENTTAEDPGLTAAKEAVGLRPDPPGPWCWPLFDREQAATAWDALARWVGGLLVPTYTVTRGQLPDCWPRHPDMVAELSWLRQAYLEAHLRGRSAARAQDWHLRSFPGVLAALKAAVPATAQYSTLLCGPGHHLQRPDPDRDLRRRGPSATRHARHGRVLGRGVVRGPGRRRRRLAPSPRLRPERRLPLLAEPDEMRTACTPDDHREAA